MPSTAKQSFCCALLLTALLASQTVLDRAQSEPLQGAAEETWVPTNRLPLNEWKSSVSQRLQPGLKWSDSLLPQPYTDDFWMPIPTWLAGTWHSEKASFIGGGAGHIGQSSDYLSRHDDRFGYQRDKIGGIWHLVRHPFISVTKSGSDTSYFIDFTPSGSSKNQFHINIDMDDVEVVVSNSDQKILEVKRRHDSSSWIKIGASITVDDLMTVNGAPTHNGTIRTQPSQVGTFKSMDKLPDGFDVRASFHRFLVNSGKSDLLPGGTAN